MKRLITLIIAATIFISGCGGTADFFDYTVPTQVNPYITRIDPSSASGGDTVTLFGGGYSTVPGLNIVIIGGVEAFADSYSLITPASGSEVESLTFTVPSGITPGNYPIYVVVVDNPSNTDLTITINP